MVAKLRENAGLSFPSTGPYAGRGPQRQEGKTLDERQSPSASLQAPSREEGREPHLSQRALGQKKVAARLPVVGMVQTPWPTHKTAHGVVFSRDVTLREAQ